MKYYEQLLDLGCFSLDDVHALTGNRRTAQSILESYKKKRLVDCVRRDLFVAMSLETKQPVPNRYAIASHTAKGAYVCYHSAFEYHGLANQVYYEVYVATRSRFRGFEYNGVTYTHVPLAIEEGVEIKVDGARVTDLERTVIDGIDDFGRSGGLEELLRFIGMIPYLDHEKLSNYLLIYDKVILYQKTGYILEHYKHTLKLPDDFFVNLRRKVPKVKRYFLPELRKQANKLSKDWALYVPVDLLSITRKGAHIDE